MRVEFDERGFVILPCLKYVHVSMKQTRCFNRVDRFKLSFERGLKNYSNAERLRKDFYSVSILIITVCEMCVRYNNIEI